MESYEVEINGKVYQGMSVAVVINSSLLYDILAVF